MQRVFESLAISIHACAEKVKRNSLPTHGFHTPAATRTDQCRNGMSIPLSSLQRSERIDLKSFGLAVFKSKCGAMPREAPSCVPNAFVLHLTRRHLQTPDRLFECRAGTVDQESANLQL